MSDIRIYSIRMRAAHRGAHVSGAERMTGRDAVSGTVQELVERAIRRQASSDEIVVTIEALDPCTVRELPALDVTAVSCADIDSCRKAAASLLVMAGVATAAAEQAVRLLAAGPSASGGNMRGAMVMDGSTGERLEPDQQRGIRASRFDWSVEASRLAEQALTAAGLGHFRTREALALATKVVHGPGVLAELCWSDDPDYTAGYVASLAFGYVRLPALKQKGSPAGGRAVFIDRARSGAGELQEYLEKQPVIVTSAGNCRMAGDISGIPARPGA